VPDVLGKSDSWRDCENTGYQQISPGNQRVTAWFIDQLMYCDGVWTDNVGIIFISFLNATVRGLVVTFYHQPMFLKNHFSLKSLARPSSHNRCPHATSCKPVKRHHNVSYQPRLAMMIDQERVSFQIVICAFFPVHAGRQCQ